MTAETINAEASGAFLVPADRVPVGYRSLTTAEMSQIFGRGAENSFGDGDDQQYDSCSGGSAPPGNDGPEGSPFAWALQRGAPEGSSCGSCRGLAVWRVSEPNVNIWLHD